MSLVGESSVSVALWQWSVFSCDNKTMSGIGRSSREETQEGMTWDEVENFV